MAFTHFLLLISHAGINILEVSGSLWALLGFHWMDVWTWILGYCFPPPCPSLASCSTQHWPPAHRNKPAEIINNKMVMDFLYMYIKTSLQNLFKHNDVYSWCIKLHGYYLDTLLIYIVSSHSPELAYSCSSLLTYKVPVR